MTNCIPDFKTDLRIASDFIFETTLCRKALESSLPGGTANIIRDTLRAVDLLAQSCHLPEFTDHGIPHLVSIVDRASQWTLVDNTLLIDSLNRDEALIFILSLLTHDLGMLSQDPLDLDTGVSTKGMSDVATWVRKTHGARLPRLLKRVLQSFGYTEFSETQFFNLVCRIAVAHEEWSWQGKAQEYPKIRAISPGAATEGYQISANRTCGIAAAVAVCDLLDEDYLRCDTETLLLHRQGNVLNKAHWIRHLLTKERVYVDRNAFKVTFRWLQYEKNPRGADINTDPSGCQSGARRQTLLDALKNQFSSALLYNDDLFYLRADLGPPVYSEENELLPVPWNLPSLHEFWGCAPERLLQSVFSFAREPNEEISNKWRRISGAAAFRSLDLTIYHRLLGLLDDIPEPRMNEEIVHESILGADL